MKDTYEMQHRLALADPYHSIIQTLEPEPDSILVGIKNVSSIPNTLMHTLEKDGFGLHTIDKKSMLAGRAVDTELYNPITGHYMSGSSSGTALNVFAGINDLGIGTDGGGSVLAPAICVNVLGFISKLISADRKMKDPKPNTDGMIAGTSIGFISRSREILYRAIYDAIQAAPSNEPAVILSDRQYAGITSTQIDVMNALSPRKELTEYLKEILAKCDALIVTEGPIDLNGFGDSLFGHFDERTKAMQEQSMKGYVRVCNPAGATALAIPQKGLGMSTLLMCESKKEKIRKLLKTAESIPVIHDELIDRYFLNLDNYFNDGYQI
ncbi:MAG: amidase family protein [Solobacterium sp.]|jgi:hypothetical protein|nr:amidase family protein [Solobacterium sp.]